MRVVERENEEKLLQNRVDMIFVVTMFGWTTYKVISSEQIYPQMLSITAKPNRAIASGLDFGVQSLKRA
jgi:hypothetical protein